MSLQIYFAGRVPRPQRANWGIKLHGNAMTGWTAGLTPNRWHRVSAVARATGGDGGHCLVIFDQMPGPATVYLKDIVLELLPSRYAAPAATYRFKVDRI
jgi:hypothetical protein